MLIFEKWYAQQFGGEYEYENDEKDSAVASEYFDYRKSFEAERKTFHDSWEFLRNHPIFRGNFEKKCLDICPVVDGELGPCILLEISYYIENDFSDEFYGTDEFICSYNDSFDVWAKTFEEAIQELALLIKTEFGDYTENDSEYAKFELRHGKENASSKFVVHQANVLILSEQLIGETDEEEN